MAKEKKEKPKTKVISVSVAYPVNFRIKVPKWYNPKDAESVILFKEKILDEAEKLFDCSSIKPLIHAADLPELVD
jgi:hypothetical protein